MGASISRLERAGGNRNAAIQSLADYFNSPGADQAEKAIWQRYQAGDPTAAQWVDQKIGETTKGKYSGVLGKAIQFVGKAAPFVLPLVPGLGPLAAGALAAGAGVAGGKSIKDALLSGVGAGAGSAVLGGQGFHGFSDALSRAKDLALGKAGATGARAGGLLGAGGTLSKISKGVGGPLNLAQLGLAGVNAVSAAQAGGRANAALDRSVGALPVGPAPGPVDLSSTFADPGNPYAGGKGTGRAARSASRALAGAGAGY